MKANDKSSQGSSFSGFGASSFPGNFKSKDFEIHDSSIGKTAPVCDKSFSQLLGAKPVDGLRLSQSLWAKSENLLRSASHGLGTAEFFLSAVGALLQGKEGDDLAEVKSLLLQVDQALGFSQCLLMGTLANFTLSKRREILEKSFVNEILQDSLLRSPLSDKAFGLSLQKVQEEVNKTPQPLRVNVQLTNGKRSASVSSSAPTENGKRLFPRLLVLRNPIRKEVLKVPRSLGLVNRLLPPCMLLTPPLGEEQFPLPSVPVGGRLTQFLHHWEKFTTDVWVLSVIRGGLDLVFQERPPLSDSPIPMSQTSGKKKFRLLSEEVQSLLLKRVIEEIPPTQSTPGFYSRLFLVAKKTGGMRPVIELSVLNSYLSVPHFKMETNRSIRACILPGMLTTKLDLSDAYFHIPISLATRKFLRFVWNNKVYQFLAVPFGLAVAPQVFTRVFQTVIVHLHTLSIQAHSYLDDSLLKEFDSEILSRHTFLFIRLLLDLGFLISWKKSQILPSQDFLFLGEHYRTDLGLIFPPEEKFQSLCQKILIFSNSPLVTARQFSQLLSFLNSLADVVPLGRLHIRPLQFFLQEHWDSASQVWEALVPILPVLLPHLDWWTHRENVLTGVALLHPVPSLTLYTDSSLQGWGAFLEGKSVSGVWSLVQQQEHINLLEMRAVLLALQHFKTLLVSKAVVLATDNTTVVAYLQNQGGTRCHALFPLCKEILLCLLSHIHLVVGHIPGTFNVLADCLSRFHNPVNTEWELRQVVFDSVVLRWDRPHVDLFATSLNHKLETFVSPVPDPLSFAVDAMSLSWDGMFAYAFLRSAFFFKCFSRSSNQIARSFLLHQPGQDKHGFQNFCFCLVPGL